MVNPLDKMRLVSLFDGLGGFALAWCRATGQDPATFGYVSSDIEPYPMAVTRARFPRHIQLGDITQLEAPAILEALAELDAGEPGKPQTQTGADKNDDALRMARPGITISPDAGGVDPKHKRRRPRGKSTTTNKPGADKNGQKKHAADLVLTFGSPCQDLSQAGRGAGLAGERSSLFFEAARLVRQLEPVYFCWENVAGAYSSNHGEDFATAVRCITDLGYSSAWSCLDAQWFGVPQRRRRLFLVGCRDGIPEDADIFDLAGRSTKKCAEQIQAIKKGLGGNPPAGRKKVQSPAAAALPGAKNSGGRVTESAPIAAKPVASALTTRGVGNTGADAAQAQAGHLVPVISTAGDITHALTAKHGVTEDGNGRGTPLVAVDAPLDPEAAAYNIQTNDGGQHRRKDRPAGGMYVSETETDLTVGGTDSTRIVETPPDSFWDGGQVAECLSTNANLQSMPEKQRFPAVITHSAPATPTVRRLTPLECTRLMGYPDEWLDGIEAGSDAKKYRALGNSLAVPCVEWIFERLADFHREHAGPGGNK